MRMGNVLLHTQQPIMKLRRRETTWEMSRLRQGSLKILEKKIIKYLLLQ